MNRTYRNRLARRKRAAFTLFEMMIVLTIIALLSGFAIYALADVMEMGKSTKVGADIDTFRTALMSYRIKNGSLPTTEQGLQALATRPTKDPVPTNWQHAMDLVPLDPWDHPYQYRIPGKHNPTGFDVFSCGPDGQPDTADDIGNWKDDSSQNSNSSSH